MPADREPPPSPVSGFIQRWTWVIALALVATYAGLAFTASLHKGVSFDEGEELAVGYDIWLYHDFRMEGANGDLVKRWATLPFLLTRPPFPTPDEPSWRSAEPYVLGYKFLFGSGNEPPMLLIQGRAMVVVLGIAAGLLVFYCSREVFGPLGGLFSLALFVFSPDMLAFGGIVSTEMSVCLTLLGSTWAVWRLLHRVNWARLLAGAGFLAWLFLAKATALVIFPLTAVLVAAKLWSGRPLEWRLGRARTIDSKGAQAAIFFGLFVFMGFWCWFCLWAQYDFRYAASPDPSNPAIGEWTHRNKTPINPTMTAVLSWSRHTHALPEGYIDGMELLLSENQARETFINGQWSVGGTPAFFPYSMWAKTPPALWVFCLLGAAWWWRGTRRQIARKQPTPMRRGGSAFSYYETMPYLAAVAVFAMVAIAQNLDISHRHILPIYPPIFVLAGGMAGAICARSRRWIKALVAVLLLLYAGDSLAIYPDYLAYFSPAVGGPAHGYQHLVESSLDWGMDLPDLKDWLDKNNPGNKEPVYFGYFGTDNPDYYGIKSTRLPSFPAWEAEGVYDLHGGVYAISATIYQSFYTYTRGPWTKDYESKYQRTLTGLQYFNATAKYPAQRAALLKKYPVEMWLRTYENFKKLRFGRLCAWLRHHHPPDGNAGHSILIWRLSEAEVYEALNGTPAEMAESSPWFDSNPVDDSKAQ